MESDSSSETSFYSTSSSSTSEGQAPLSRQERAFEACCRICFNAGKKGNHEERAPIIDQITSSDETVKQSIVTLTRGTESWRTANDSAWLLLHFGSLCEIWGVVISWWCNCFADRVILASSGDEQGEFWNAISGTDYHKFLTFDKVTRIDFNRVATNQLRIELRGGHLDFLMKRFKIGIRQIEVIGCRANILQDLWQPPERPLVEEGLRKVDRDMKQYNASREEEIKKKLYMPGEALQEALAMCRKGEVPPWLLVKESGMMELRQVWPGTRSINRMQTEAKHRWTEKDPAHPSYWMSPRERIRLQHEQEQQQNKVVSDEEEDNCFEEWDLDEIRNESKSSGNTRPTSAMSRPASASAFSGRPSTPVKYSSRPSTAGTRPTTAGTSRVGSRPTTAGTRPSTPGLYGARSRPSSSGAYAARFGSSRPGASRPATAGPARPSSSGAYASRTEGPRPSSALKTAVRPSTAGKQRPGLTFEGIYEDQS